MTSERYQIYVLSCFRKLDILGQLFYFYFASKQIFKTQANENEMRMKKLPLKRVIIIPSNLYSKLIQLLCIPVA